MYLADIVMSVRSAITGTESSVAFTCSKSASFGGSFPIATRVMKYPDQSMGISRSENPTGVSGVLAVSLDSPPSLQKQAIDASLFRLATNILEQDNFRVVDVFVQRPPFAEAQPLVG